jgi:CDP-2,3-bis-(O-geranylgeranyl)-sn-glycerol synthase
MWNLILGTLYLFLPAYAANMAPVVAARLHLFPALARPLDGDRHLGANPILGPHKTVRGVVVGVAAGLLAALLQRALLPVGSFWEDLTLFPYGERSALLWGLLLGGGAILGDIGKSFVKRRFGILPGMRWFPWDQLDMVFGALLLGFLLYPFSWPSIAIVIVLTPLLGLVVNLGGYMLRVKEAW